jgi:Fic family protein
MTQKLGNPVFISISNSIEKDKSKYYSELKKAQRNLELRSGWFTSVIFCRMLFKIQKILPYLP